MTRICFKIPRYFYFAFVFRPVFYDDLVYKLRRVKDIPNFISSDFKIFKRIRCRQYNAVIIEMTTGLMISPFYSIEQAFPKALHSYKQGDVDYTTDLV